MTDNNTPTQRTCAYCGKPIPPSKRIDAQYDTEYCRWAAHNERKKKAEK